MNSFNFRRQNAYLDTTRAELTHNRPHNIHGHGQHRELPQPTRTLTEIGENEFEDEDEENMGVAETYSQYVPKKLKLGIRHPDAVVETVSLASVDPPDITYQLAFPKSFIEAGTLSALQLEAVTYASQQHEQFLPDGSRAGFLIGDGAGVGKGRTSAGIIWQNWLNGRKKAIWISVSSDLKFDAQRDLRDIGATNISVHPLNKMKYAKISAAVNGSVTEGVIFCTYSSLISKSHSSGQCRTRLAQMVQWCGGDFDGVIVFDECHRAKNLVADTEDKESTKTGLAVLELQLKLPKARVVYASATGASEPRNMAYMARLGLWGDQTPFREFKDFFKAVEGRGVGAMEIVAMEMKHRGIYIARQLSFHHVTFRIEQVPLTAQFISVYDEAVTFWVKLLKEFEDAATLLRMSEKEKKQMRCKFWGAHQRFFKYLCISAKVKQAVKVANEAVEAGKCVVIGLQSTGEARTLDQLDAEGQLSDFVSSAKGVVESLISKHFPGSDQVNDGTRSRRPARKRIRVDSGELDAVVASDSGQLLSIESDSDSDFPEYDPIAAKLAIQNRSKFNEEERERKCRSYVYSLERGNSAQSNDKSQADRSKLKLIQLNSTKERLLAEFKSLGARLPTNALDQLIDEFGGPDKVAEMTGRRGRVVQDCNGRVQYESRAERDVSLEDVNREEKERFMSGQKDVAIISEAASSGISLQADRRVINQRRRVHVTLELPWSADRAVQQFGRTHRSNQVNAPEYVFLISQLAGERRFASAVAKRLEGLGALTHGDRRATETCDLSQFNVFTKFGRSALRSVMGAVGGTAQPKVPPPADDPGDFFQDVYTALLGVGYFCQVREEDSEGVSTKNDDISKFLNRILGIPVHLQNGVFKLFMDTLGVIVSEAKKAGRYDRGIMDLGTQLDSVRRIKSSCFTVRHPTGRSRIVLDTVEMDRGISWQTAKDMEALLMGEHEGFYRSNEPSRTGARAVALVTEGATGTRPGSDIVEQFYSVYRPNLGLMVKQETIEEIKSKYKKISVQQAERYWRHQYEFFQSVCFHTFRNGLCKTSKAGLRCSVGMRRCTFNVLSGSLLSVWDKVQKIYQKGNKSKRLRVVRLRLDGQRIVGTDIASNCLEPVLRMLSTQSAVDLKRTKLT